MRNALTGPPSIRNGVQWHALRSLVPLFRADRKRVQIDSEPSGRGCIGASSSVLVVQSPNPPERRALSILANFYTDLSAFRDVQRATDGSTWTLHRGRQKTEALVDFGRIGPLPSPFNSQL